MCFNFLGYWYNQFYHHLHIQSTCTGTASITSTTTPTTTPTTTTTTRPLQVSSPSLATDEVIFCLIFNVHFIRLKNWIIGFYLSKFVLISRIMFQLRVLLPLPTYLMEMYRDQRYLHHHLLHHHHHHHHSHRAYHCKHNHQWWKLLVKSKHLSHG